MEYTVFLNQIFILGVLVLIGVLAVRFRVITEPVKEGLAKIIFNITLPLLVLVGISEMDISLELVENSLLALLFSFLVLGLMTLIGVVSSRIAKLPPKSSSVHIVHTMFGNIVYLGFPLINVLFPGGEGLFYAMLFHLASSLIMWTAGINILQNNHRDWKGGLKNLMNPNTFAFLIGFLMLSFSIKLPVFLSKSLGGLGDTTIYLSMLYIGAMLASINWKKAIASGQAYLLSFNKLILIPVLSLGLYLIMFRLFSFKLDEPAASVIILESAMPCMANIVVLAKIYGADDKQATENVFISTILSILSLPVIYYLISAVL